MFVCFIKYGIILRFNVFCPFNNIFPKNSYPKNVCKQFSKLMFRENVDSEKILYFTCLVDFET